MLGHATPRPQLAIPVEYLRAFACLSWMVRRNVHGFAGVSEELKGSCVPQHDDTYALGHQCQPALAGSPVTNCLLLSVLLSL